MDAEPIDHPGDQICMHDRLHKMSKQCEYEEMNEILIALSEQDRELRALLNTERITSRAFEEAAISLQKKCDSLQKTLSEVYRENKERKSPDYGMLLLDADAIHFNQSIFSSSGSSNGSSIAESLVAAVRLKLDLTDNDTIHVRVYGNISWLADLYSENGFVKIPEDFKSFVHEFNTAAPWVEFENVGTSQNASKQRVLELLRLHLGNRKCKGLILGCKIGSQLANTLEAALEGLDVSSLIVNLVRQSPKSDCPNPEYEKVASLTGRFLDFGQYFLPKSLAASVFSPLLAQDRLNFDSRGYRIDPRVAHTQTMIDWMASQTFCNNHYLKGKCTYTRCPHKHSTELRKAEMEALAFLGRSIKCRNGPCCKEFNCYAGHVCPRGNCDGLCGFAREEHLPGVLANVRRPPKSPKKGSRSWLVRVKEEGMESE